MKTKKKDINVYCLVHLFWTIIGLVMLLGYMGLLIIFSFIKIFVHVRLGNMVTFKRVR